jgi:hypothetical protein
MCCAACGLARPARGRRRLAQRLGDRLEQFGGRCRLLHDAADADRLGERPDLVVTVVRGVEEQGYAAGLRIVAHLLSKLISIDSRHEHVGQHDIGVQGSRELQRLSAVNRLDDVVSTLAEGIPGHLTVRGAVIHDQDSCHLASPGSHVMRFRWGGSR